MKDLNICLLNDSFPPYIDGVANAVKNYADVIKEDGGNPIVITPENPDADDSIYDYKVIRYPGIDTRKLVGYYAGLPFAPNIIKAAKNENISLIHSHCPIASNIVARSIQDVIDKPIVFTYHTKFDIDIAKAIKGELLQEGAIKFLVDNISASDEVWVVSNGAGENLKSLGYEGDYIVMNNGVDIKKGKLSKDTYMSLTNPRAFKKNVPTFLFVGRLMWYKGIRVILDALSALKSQDIDFRMIFIGSGQDEKEIKNYAKKVRVWDKCSFLGKILDRETLSAYYSRADLFLFPSEFDTNGLVVREAAALEMPSVLISNSAAAEGVTKNENGFLIENNAASLSALLARLTLNMDFVHKVGKNAQDSLYLSWEDAIKIAEDRYQVVIDKYNSSGYKKHNSLTSGLIKFNTDLLNIYTNIEDTINNIFEEI